MSNETENKTNANTPDETENKTNANTPDETAAVQPITDDEAANVAGGGG